LKNGMILVMPFFFLNAVEKWAEPSAKLLRVVLYNLDKTINGARRKILQFMQRNDTM